MPKPLPRRRRPREDNTNVPKNAPVFAIIAAVCMFGGGIILVVTGNGGKGDGAVLIDLLVTTLPALLAAGYAERTSRDVRNGTVTEKARQGTRKALDEAGVVTVDGPVTQAALTSQAASTAALTALLERVMPAMEHNTDVTEAVADALDVEHNGKEYRDVSQQP